MHQPQYPGLQLKLWREREEVGRKEALLLLPVELVLLFQLSYEFVDMGCLLSGFV